MWVGGAAPDRGRVRVPLRALAPRLGLGGRPDLAHRPRSRRASSCSSPPTYAGLFHEVSSDPVFAFLLAWWAGAVVRAWSTGSTVWLVGGRASASRCSRCAGPPRRSRCSPACSSRSSRGAAGRRSLARRRRRASRPRSPARRLGGAQRRPLRRLHRRAREQGVGAVLPRRRRRRPGERRRVAAPRRRRRAERPHAAAVREPRRRRPDVLPRRRQPRGDPDDRALRPGVRLGHGLRRAVRRLDRGDPRRSVAVRRGRRPRRSGTSSRSATRPSRASGRCRSPSCPPSSTIDGKPFPAPITVSPLVQAVRYGFVWCPTDDLERCVVPDPAAALGDAGRGAALRRARRHDPRLERAAADARLERLARLEGRHRERPLAAPDPLDRGRGGRARRPASARHRARSSS